VTARATLALLLRTRVTLVWGALVGATVVSWQLGVDHGLRSHADERLVSAAVLLIAFTKVRFVGLYFMELRRAPWALRGLFEGYCLLVFTVVLAVYLGG
jgi:hypothetical protein